MTVDLITTALAALALAFGGEPLPDHPVTGKPVQPTWSYSYVTTTKDYRLLLRCHVPVRSQRWCEVIGKRVLP